MLSSIIGAAGSLLGGLFGKSEAPPVIMPEQNLASHLKGVREQSEKWGFNPLTVLGSVAPQTTVLPSSQNYMGSAIADSALMLADGLAKTKAAAMGRSVQDLNRQKNILANKLRDATLRPKVGGVYDGARTFGTGAANANSSGSLSSGARGAGMGADDDGDPLGVFPDRDPIDPRREIENMPITNDGGIGVIDNPVTGRFHIPLINGEVPDIWQYPTIAGSWAADRAYWAGVDYQSQRWKDGLIKKYQAQKPKPREFWTHEWTGFSAPRQFGAY